MLPRTRRRSEPKLDLAVLIHVILDVGIEALVVDAVIASITVAGNTACVDIAAHINGWLTARIAFVVRRQDDDRMDDLIVRRPRDGR